MRTRSTLLLAGLALAACADQPTSSVAPPLAAIADGASGGNSHFFFLTPMVPNPPAGSNDATLDPVVVICQWDGAACAATLATFTTDLSTTQTTQPGNSETVRRGEDHFIVDWHTDGFDLDAALTYRICVKVGDAGLGFADVDLAASGRDLRVGAEGYVAVLDGRTLPIRFRIEAGALEQATAGTCSGGSGQDT